MANIEIGGRLHSTATGNVVTGANEVLDDTKNKKQSVINAEVDETIGDDNTAGTIKGRIKTAEGKLDTLNGDSSTSGSVAKAVADAKTELIGGATSNGNTLKKVEDRTATLETAVGSNGSVDQRIAAAKSEVIGNAASDYNTLGKLEDKIQAEASARQDAITAETNRATTRENQIYDLVHTPEQHYVTVATYAELANIASPSDDTIYRVSSYNGNTSQVDNTVYSEYGYDGTNFIFLCVKSQIDEVYDISAHHSNNTYVDLAAALDGGNNIPQELRKGGMSVKFVQSSDNKYVQYRLMSDSFNTTPANWQGVDDEPTAGSDNFVKSGGVAKSVSDCRTLAINNVIKEKIFVGKLENGILDTTESGYITTDYIEVKDTENTIYNIDFVYGEGTVNMELELACYDANKNFIDCWYNIRTKNERTVNIKSLSTTPSYYRASFKVENIMVSSLYDYIYSETMFSVKSIEDFENDIDKSTKRLFDGSAHKNGIILGSTTLNLLNPNNLVYGISFRQSTESFISEPNGVISDFIWLGQFSNSDSLYVGGLPDGGVCYLIALSSAELSEDSVLDEYLINSTAGRTISVDTILEGQPSAKYIVLQLQGSSVQDYSNIRICKGVSMTTDEYKPVVIGVKGIEEYGNSIFDNPDDYGIKGFSFSKDAALSTSRGLKEFFKYPIKRDNVSNVRVRIHDTSTSQDDGFKLIVYAIYDDISASPVRLNPQTITGEYTTDVPMENHVTLYGIQFYNSDASREYFTYDITVFGKIKPIENVVPEYYRVNNYLDNKIKRVSDLIRLSIINGDAFYFITDIHWELNQKHSPAIINEMEKYLSIGKIFNGGDVYHLGRQTDYYDTACINALRGSIAYKSKVYTTDGNHEFIGKFESLGDTFAQSRIFLQDAVFGGAGKNYYYVDNTDKKIRYIILASFGPYDGDTITLPFEDLEQQNWFENTALNLESNWRAIIFTHTLVDANMQGKPYFIGGGQAIADIIGRKSNVLAVFEGHAHRDCVYMRMCACPIIVTTCDMNVPFTVGGVVDLEVDRTTGTKNEQAFESVIFNKEENAFHVVRIGAGATNRISGLKEETQSEERVVYVDSLNVGNTKTLPDIFAGETLWTSSTSSVATVSNGIVTAVATGEVIICAEEVATGNIVSYFIRIN